jgi:hypothetical protein
MEMGAHELKVGSIPQVSAWSRSGPLLLLAAFAIFLFKIAPNSALLTLTAFLGYGAIRVWKKAGLFLSLAALCALTITTLWSEPNSLWTLSLSLSIALSWFLIYQSGQEAEITQIHQEEAIATLESGIRELEKQLRTRSSAHLDEAKGTSKEIERLQAVCDTVHQTLKTSEAKREELEATCTSLTQDVYANKSALARAEKEVEDLKIQLSTMKDAFTMQMSQVESVISQEEGGSEEETTLEVMKHQYANLREQFEEKSLKLDEARKDLFRTESECLVLQKREEEKKYEVSEEESILLKTLKESEEERLQLELMIASQEEVISTLISVKKSPIPKKEKASRKKQPA